MPVEIRICICGCQQVYEPVKSWQKFYPGHQGRYWKAIREKASEMVRSENEARQVTLVK